jgi:hypothetical protein
MLDNSVSKNQKTPQGKHYCGGIDLTLPRKTYLRFITVFAAEKVRNAKLFLEKYPF